MAGRSDGDVVRVIGQYRTYLSRREQKYTRNWNRYTTNGARTDSIWELFGNPLAYYYNTADQDTGLLPVLNVIRSCIQTHVSKISQTKVRPFFNPVNGTYETYKVCENAQIFFDEYFQEENVYKKATEALRDAEIFEFGVCWIDEREVKVKKVSPWQFFYDPAEMNFGKLTKCFLEFRQYPAAILLQGASARKVPQTIKDQLTANPEFRVKYNVFYDLMEKERIELVNDQVFARYPLTSDTVPFEIIWYDNPVKGGFSTSLVDNLYTIQTQIDTLAHRIHLAAELNPANSIFIPVGAEGEMGSIKKSMISNRIGNVYEYSAGSGAGQPVVSTPRAIDDQYIQLLNMFIEKAYEMEGISQLSALSKKPSGLNSGVALDTYQDVESERHNVILQSYIRFLMGIAIKMVELFPDDGLVIPARRGISAITWKQVKDSREEFALQFSPASVLSNDPQTKMQQIEKLLAMKVITAPLANKLLEFPDLNGAYNVVNASYDDCQAVIQRAIEDEDYQFYEVINLQELFTETTNMILRLDSNNEDPAVISRLVTLLNKIKNQMKELADTANPPGSPPPPPAVPLAGPQVTAVLEVLDKVRAGSLNPDTATGLISAVMPATPSQVIADLVQKNIPQQLPGATIPVEPAQPGPEV